MRFTVVVPLTLLLTACGTATETPAATQDSAPTADAVCAQASTDRPDINLRATVVQQAQISADSRLRQLSSIEHDPNHGGTATAVVDTDEGAPPVAKRYDAVYAFCQSR